MRTFDHYCNLVGYKQTNFLQPEIEYVWYVYDAGKVVTYHNEDDIPPFTKNIEKVQTEKSKAENKSFWFERTKLHNQAVDRWMTDLRFEYEHLPDSYFDECYFMACTRSEHNGYDSVAETMDDLVKFAERIIACYIRSLTPNKL